MGNERNEAIDAFEEEYQRAKKQYGLVMHRRLSASGECELELHRKTRGSKELIAKVTTEEDDGTTLHRRALRELEFFLNKHRTDADTMTA